MTHPSPAFASLDCMLDCTGSSVSYAERQGHLAVWKKIGKKLTPSFILCLCPLSIAQMDQSCMAAVTISERLRHRVLEGTLGYAGLEDPVVCGLSPSRTKPRT